MKYAHSLALENNILIKGVRILLIKLVNLNVSVNTSDGMYIHIYTHIYSIFRNVNMMSLNSNALKVKFLGGIFIVWKINV